MQVLLVIYFMLLERKTLYDTRVHSHNPQCCKIHLCTTREIEEKELCIIDGESGQQVFYTAIKKKKKKKEKLRKKEGREEIHNLQKHQERTILIFLILYLR